MLTPRRYVLVLDESGRKNLVARGERRAFVFGGFVIPEDRIEHLRGKWPGICEDYGPQDGSEMKARAFRERLGTIYGDDMADDFAQALVSTILRAQEALPIVVLVDRANIDTGVCNTTRKGTHALNQPLLSSPLLAGFGVFLGKHSAYGRVCMDQLTSEQEHQDVRESIAEIRRMTGEVETHRIEAEPTFVVSADTPEVQLADLLVGTIARPYEQRVSVVDGLGSLLKEAEPHGLGIIHVQ